MKMLPVGITGAAALLSALLLLAACAAPSANEAGAASAGLEGTVWDASTGEAISEAALDQRLASARFVLLGEKHDNPAHHRKQADLLDRMAATGRRPPVVWEMIDASKAAVLKAYLESGRATPEGLGRVLDWGGSGWPEWAIYQPIAEVALRRGLQQYPGNIERPIIRTVMQDGFGGLPNVTAQVLATNARWTDDDAQALKTELVDSHCGVMPEGMMRPMGLVQRARDAVMAAALLEADVGAGAVLIAGNGHVRADRGVPRYLEPETNVLSIGILEAQEGETDAMAYLEGPGHFDIVIFTESVQSPDRCEALRKRFGK